MTVKHIMLDIETLGREPGCVVFQIGAVVFGPLGLSDPFEADIDLESAMAAGLTIEPATLAWWAQLGLLHPNGRAEFLPQALARFRQWCAVQSQGAEGLLFWANSPSFDCDILEAAMRAVDLAPPWTYRTKLDFRTMKLALPKVTVDDEGEAHNALDDAKWQARYLLKAGLFTLGGF